MLGILAGMDHKNSCSGMFEAGFAGDSAPCAVSSLRQAHDAPHHGRLAPEKQLPEAYRKISIIWEMPCCLSTAPCIWKSLVQAVCLRSTGLLLIREMTPGMVSVCSTPWFDSGYMLGVSLRGLLSSTLQKTAESPHLQFIDGRRHSLRYAEADSHGPACLADHGDFAVADHAWWSMPLVCSRAGSCSAAAVRRRGRQHPCCRCADGFIPWSRLFVRPGIPQLLTWWSTSLFTGRAGSLPRRGTEADSMVHTVRLTMDNPELLYTMADVPVVRSHSSRVQTWRRQLSSHNCGSSFCVDTVVHIPVVVQRQMPGGSDVTVAVTSRG